MARLGFLRVAARSLASAPTVIDVAFVAGIAAALRLSGLDLAPWGQNQAEILQLVDPIVNHGSWPVVGWEISGRFGGSLPALLFWILAIPRFLTSSPILLVGFAASFDVLAAVLVCMIGRILWGRAAGFAAGLLYALDATLIAHAQILWNLTMVPCLTAALTLGLTWLVVERRPVGFVVVLPCLAVLTQLHFLTLYLVPPVLLSIAFTRVRPRARHMVVGLALALLLYAPYLLHEVQKGLPNLRAVRDIVVSVYAGADHPGDEVACVIPDANRGPLARAATFRGAEFPHLPTRLIEPKLALAPFVRVFWLAVGVQGLMAIVGSVCLVVEALRSRRVPARGDPPREPRVAGLLLAMYALPIAALAMARLRIYDRYLLPLDPLRALLAVAWLPTIRASSSGLFANRAARLVVPAALVGAIAVPQLVLLHETRDEARRTGLIDEDGTLGTKLEIARFFRDSIKLGPQEFARDVTFFAWPGTSTPDRHRGFEHLFPEHASSGEGSADGSHYLVVYPAEARHVIDDVVSTGTFVRDHFWVLRLDRSIEVGFASRARSVPADWWHAQGVSDGASRAPLPLAWHTDLTQGEGSNGDAYLEVPITVAGPDSHPLLVVQSRDCIQRIALDGVDLAVGSCSGERARDEQEAVVRAYPLDGKLAAGVNVARLQIVPRYASSSIDAYVLPLSREGGTLTAPPGFVRYARFVARDPRRFRIHTDAPPVGMEQLALPVLDPAKPILPGPDTAVSTAFRSSVWGLATWRVAYSFASRASYVMGVFSPRLRSDFRDYDGVVVAMKSEGPGGAFRVVLRDGNGHEWRYHDEAAMWDNVWVGLAIPFDAFERVSEGEHPESKLELANIDAVMIQVVPGKAPTPIHDLVVRFTEPVLVKRLPRRLGWSATN